MHEVGIFIADGGVGVGRLMLVGVVRLVGVERLGEL